MRPVSFHSDELRSLLLRSKTATLDELKQALGTAVDVTVFRKLKPLDYLTSYSHRGRYYTRRLSTTVRGRQSERLRAEYSIGLDSLVLQLAGRTTAPFVCRTGIAETGPWRRSSTGRFPRPRSSYRGSRTP